MNFHLPQIPYLVQVAWAYVELLVTAFPMVHHKMVGVLMSEKLKLLHYIYIISLYYIKSLTLSLPKALLSQVKSSSVTQSKITKLRSVHTETFSCVFVLFQVMSWLFLIPLRTINNTKTQENVSVCTGP